MNENEVWKDIPGYEGKYQASNMGRIKSLSRYIKCSNLDHGITERLCGERILRSSPLCRYYGVDLCKNSKYKRFYIHQLVLLTFVGLPKENQEVCHTNGNRYDNRLCNLRYDTHSENNHDTYHYGNKYKKLYKKDIQEIRNRFLLNESNKKIAQEFGVTPKHIARIRRGCSYEWLSSQSI